VALLLAVPYRAPSRAALADRLLAGYLLGYLSAYWLLAFNAWDRYLLLVQPLALVLAARALWQVAGWSAIAIRRWIGPRRSPGHLASMLRVGAALAVLLALIPGAVGAAHSAYPIGGDHGAYDGVDAAGRFLRSLPEGTVLYDHWLSWQWNFYAFDGPVYVAWFANPAALEADLRAFGATSPRFLAVPVWEADTELRAAARAAGYTFVPRFTAYRRDGLESIRLYELVRSGG
jgi:hypothetical protein